MRSMKKLPPRNVCRPRPSRSSPSTDEIRVGASTAGMWHDWQLRSPRNALCRHSRYGTCSGSSPNDLALWSERLGEERVARRAQLGLADVRRLGRRHAGRRAHQRGPAGIDVERSEHPALAAAVGGLMTKPPVKLSRVPRRSGPI